MAPQMTSLPQRGGPGGPQVPPGVPKRPAGPSPQQQAAKPVKKKKKLADKILPQKVRELVPESQAYMDLLAFERKPKTTINRKRLDIQEALKRPIKLKKKLWIFIFNTSFPAKEGEEGSVATWEMREEGRLLAEDIRAESTKVKHKFSFFFKSLVIELDKEMYGQTTTWWSITGHPQRRRRTVSG